MSQVKEVIAIREDGMVDVAPSLSSIPPFDLLLKGKDKVAIRTALKYIYFMGAADSPLRHVSLFEKEAMILSMIEMEKVSDLVRNCLICYTKLSEVPTARLYRACIEKMDQMAKFISETDITMATLKPLMDAMRQIPNYFVALKSVELEAMKAKSDAVSPEGKSMFEG